MTLYAQVTKEIRSGPSGRECAAFFDLDRTLLSGFSAFAFFQHRLLSGRMSPRELVESIAAATSFGLGRTGFSGLVGGAAAAFRGFSERALMEIGEEIFEKQLAREIYPESRALVEAHQHMGHVVAIVSSALPHQVEPVARALGIEHVLCTRLETRDGVFTGRIVRPTCYGEGKAFYARELAQKLGCDLSHSTFYSDSHEDLPLFEIVGNPRPLNPDRTLSEIAQARGWPARSFRSRGTPGLAEVARTALAWWSVLPSFASGIPVALMNGSRRDAVNVGMATWGEIGTALAGIELAVEGEEHLWAERPAVFIFNHQSGIDTLLLCKLLRRDVVAIGKQELRRTPLLGPIFAWSGMVFVDRDDHGKAVAALGPAVEALRSGLSIAIAPEGTRSSTTHVGPFKKGAFHLAMQAGVPIVPVVFRNALDALPKHSMLIRPARVEAVVHAPISTREWRREDLDSHVERVRSIYVETLEP
ncbi:Phosphoserine phosphatase SerB1 [Myxococcaceae bacterium]|jgi:putative phosphoserine phosphatase/1-acylglycerol-3-phosphate O-acyltransferase|nr:Phosphoserine phosphatase SerB1 [Myxococcaceae bacterium]